jgi:hypothetical protein
MRHRGDKHSGRGSSREMIENEQQLMYAYENLVKMNRLKERCATESLWRPSARADVTAGIENQMRKIEREIAEYLARRAETERVA